MKFTEQQDIESISFVARANIASDLNTFLEVIATESAVVSLKRRLRDEPSMIDSLVKAMRHLSDLDYDDAFENPADTAVATYGWIIAKEYPALEGLVTDLLRSLQNSWWSIRLAERFQSKNRKTLQSIGRNVNSEYVVSNQFKIERIGQNDPSSLLSAYLLDLDQSEKIEPGVNFLQGSFRLDGRIRNTLYRDVQANLGVSARLVGSVVKLAEIYTCSRSHVDFISVFLDDDIGLRVDSENFEGRDVRLSCASEQATA